MSDRVAIGLDNPAFQGRLRQPDRLLLFSDTAVQRRALRHPVSRYRRRISDIRINRPAASSQSTNSQPHFYVSPVEQPLAPEVIAPQPFVEPARPKQQPSRVLTRRSVRLPWQQHRLPSSRIRRPAKLQVALVGMAVVVFVVGLVSSLQTIKTNHNATAQVASLARKTNSVTGAAVVPSITKPTTSAVSNYVVAPNLPRYLRIPKLGVDARVLQVGVTSSGALGIPPNVFDAAWYTGSAEPGQPGATLIDGHVSSWTSHGVFYRLKTLVPGDAIQIERGDGTLFNYQVVKTQVYDANNVDMQAAITPITPGTPGLNLITCTGNVIAGTSTFNERVIVFAQQV